jgi:hypothetical protein
VSWLAIELHEFGHFAAYRVFDYSARMSLQRVTSTGPVPAGVDHIAKAAGPGVTLIAGIDAPFPARRRFFRTKGTLLKASAIYALSPSVGVGVIILDELFGWDK